MSRLLEKIALKKVIIWGVGAIQLDMEALFPTIKTAYYVDDRLEEKGGRIPNNYKKRILTPESLLTEQKEDIFILICEQNRDSALGFLDKNGFIKGMHYVSYERILYEFPSPIDKIFLLFLAKFGYCIFATFLRFLVEGFLPTLNSRARES